MARPISTERQAAEKLAGKLAEAGVSTDRIKASLRQTYETSRATNYRIMESLKPELHSVTLEKSVSRLKRMCMAAELEGDAKAYVALHKELRETMLQQAKAIKAEAAFADGAGGPDYYATW